MTRFEEAVHQLQSILDVANKNDCNSKEIDALDEKAINMGIKALVAIDEIESLCKSEIANIAANWLHYRSPSEAKGGFQKVLARLWEVMDDAED